MMNKILIVGKQGQVAWELQRTLACVGEATALSSSELDLADASAIRKAVREHAPKVIVNAAAYTAVDKAETEADIAQAVNGAAPGILAEEAKRLGALLIHYSTDYVFDGGSTETYRETDATNPLGVYGRSKLAGEEAIQATGGRYLILRTAWVYGARGKNFLLTMLRLGKEREELGIVDDQRGTPTWSRMIAQATAHLVAAAPAADQAGIYHLTSGGQCTWYEFAQAIFDAGVIDRPPRVKPIATADYPTPAARPANSVLDNTKLAEHFRIALPHWRNALGLCMEELRP